ncbi:MAG: hypothetical protein Q7V57_01765 [Actinomycetota bacterium]|nr:hypothetical protein [Actinomycetota bacterium]
MSDVVESAIGGSIGWNLGQRFNRRRARRLASQSRVECSLRRASDSTKGPGTGWTHGVADLAPGLLEFTSFLPPGIRIPNPFRKRLNIEVVSVSVVGPRLAASWLGPGPGTVGVTLVGVNETFEVGLQESSAAWFVTTVAPTSSESA